MLFHVSDKPSVVISHFQCSLQIIYGYQGRRFSLRSRLAPSYHIPRLWRCASNVDHAFIDTAFGAACLNIDTAPDQA